jgi:hypothetical protein
MPPMKTYDVALFLHILVLLAAIGLGSILHSGEWRSRGATTIAELRVHTKVYSWGKLFPVLILLLFGTGAWLLHLSDDRFDFGTPWVWTAIVALVILFVSGGAVLGRHAAGFGKLLAAQPDGPISPEVRAQAFAPAVWVTSHMNTALAISVAFNMVTKPETDAKAVIAPIVGIVVGSLIGLAARPKG